VHASAAVVAEQVPPSAGVLEEAGPDSCVLTSGSDSLNAIAFHIVMMGPRFTVLEPPELIEHMRSLASRLTEAVQSGS
jgi:predicted DNA-binding transcriptional regulator YafY